ncbi:YciI family protein [Stutzerimonas azotifigens]|uniref:YciI family protein n=1 Tax=Stutzerimonas azotifigens TaxID=291995 RepID=UPI00041D4E32|nr:YciI family protein [Stutzerimonas azotifigens]
MKYLCLVYLEPDALETLPAERRRALFDEAAEHLARLGERDRLLVAESLQPAADALRLCRRGGRLRLEALVGTAPVQAFCLLEARDLNEAVLLASGLPQGRLGCIEVRPVGALSASPQPPERTAP